MKEKFKTYALSIAAALSVGLFSALLTAKNMRLYESINRPPLSPPSWLFPVVWTILYILMGVSAAIVQLNRAQNPGAATAALRIYAVQLGVNLLWSVIFFNLRAFLAAFIWLIILWLLIVAMISAFGKVAPTAARLQIPYLLWVSFAGYLNLAIYLLN